MDWRSWGTRGRDERGQTAVEYAVVVAMVALVVALFLAIIPGNEFDTLWETVTGVLNGAGS